MGFFQMLRTAMRARKVGGTVVKGTNGNYVVQVKVHNLKVEPLTEEMLDRFEMNPRPGETADDVVRRKEEIRRTIRSQK